MEMKLSKWGNGYGVRIPKEVLNSIGISSEKLNEDCVKLETTGYRDWETDRKRVV